MFDSIYYFSSVSVWFAAPELSYGNDEILVEKSEIPVSPASLLPIYDKLLIFIEDCDIKQADLRPTNWAHKTAANTALSTYLNHDEIK